MIARMSGTPSVAHPQAAAHVVAPSSEMHSPEHARAVAYRPEIDGLRAVAVVPVILFHMGFGWIAGGFIGVDVFFVISGFLITSIVITDIRRGTFRFRDFWARRVRRILPAMLTVTTCTLAFAMGVVFRPDQQEIGRQALASLASVANLYFWRMDGGYWGRQAEESPFLHMWSLSVEEQFYLLLPLGVWLVMKYRPRLLPAALLALIVGSLSLFLFAIVLHPSFTFYALPTRAWELATGCFLATVVTAPGFTLPRAGTPLSALAAAGLGLVVASYVVVPTLGGGLSIAVIGTALVIAFGADGGVRRLLASGPAVHIGRMSYSLYLWHWPVLVFADYLRVTTHKALLFVPIYLLARVSYALVEEPVRLSRARVVPVVALAFATVLGMAAALARTPGSYDISEYARARWYGTVYDVKPRGEMNEDFRRIVSFADAPPRRAPADAFRRGGIILGPGTDAPDIVVLGDSHGTMWSEAIHSVAKARGLRAAFISMNGVSPLMTVPVTRQPASQYLSSDEKYAYDSSRLALIASWKPDVVIVAARWASEGRSQPDDLVGYLTAHAGRVLLLEQPPELDRVGNRSVVQYLAFRSIHPDGARRQYLPGGNAAAVSKGRTLIRDVASRHPRTVVVPVHDVYAHGSDVLALDGREVVYFDDDHLTAYGASLAIPTIERAIEPASGQDPATSPRNASAALRRPTPTAAPSLARPAR